MRLPPPTALIFALLLLLSISLVSTSCYKQADEVIPVADTVLDKAVVYHPGGVTMYNFTYRDGKLSEVRSHHSPIGSSGIVATVWAINRDQNGNISTLKSFSNLTEDTTVCEFSYTNTWQLSGIVSKQKTKGHTAIYPVDSIDFNSQGATTTGWSWVNSPFLLKTEYQVNVKGNLEGKTIYSGYGGNPPFLPVAFNSSVYYTYDSQRAPIKMEHCELFYGGFRDNWFRSMNNNILSESLTNTSGPRMITSHRYTYNGYGQPLTDTILRHTGDTIRVYYRYK